MEWGICPSEIVTGIPPDVLEGSSGKGISLVRVNGPYAYVLGVDGINDPLVAYWLHRMCGLNYTKTRAKSESKALLQGVV